MELSDTNLKQLRYDKESKGTFKTKLKIKEKKKKKTSMDKIESSLEMTKKRTSQFQDKLIEIIQPEQKGKLSNNEFSHLSQPEKSNLMYSESLSTGEECKIYIFEGILAKIMF